MSDYDTLWSTSNVDKNGQKTAQILGKGSMDMKVIITDSDGGYWTKPFNVNFNTETSKTIK